MRTIYQNNLEEIKEEYTLEEIKTHVSSYYNTDITELEELEDLDLFYSVEDDIIDDFYNGNWTDGGEKMLEENINPNDLMYWLEEQREERGETYCDFITLTSVVAIVDSYNQARRNS